MNGENKEEHFLTGHERLVEEMRREHRWASRSTPWWKLVLRIAKARRNGRQIRVQVKVNGDWMYMGQRR